MLSINSLFGVSKISFPFEDFFLRLRGGKTLSSRFAAAPGSPPIFFTPCAGAPLLVDVDNLVGFEALFRVTTLDREGPDPGLVEEADEERVMIFCVVDCIGVDAFP